MKDIKRFQTKKTHRVCINLEPRHFKYLKQLSQKINHGNISLTILYLLSKNIKYLSKINKTYQKRTFTITYQPISKKYKKFWITINPTIWGQLNNLRFYLGFSMSFILRILIDWEMQQDSETLNTIPVPKPDLTFNELKELSHHHIKSYAQKVSIVHRARLVYMDFMAFY